MITSLTDEIGALIQQVIVKRESIKQEYVKAWLAATIPTENLNVDWLIKNVRLVETWSKDGRSVSWHLATKDDPR